MNGGGVGLEEWILEAAREVRGQFPDRQGKCLAASQMLVERLEARGVVCAVQFGSFKGMRHAWVDIWTKAGVLLLDVTADQFGDYPGVVVGKVEDWPEYGWDVAAGREPGPA